MSIRFDGPCVGLIGATFFAAQFPRQVMPSHKCFEKEPVEEPAREEAPAPEPAREEAPAPEPAREEEPTEENTAPDATPPANE